MNTAKNIIFSSLAHGDHSMADVLDGLTIARGAALSVAAISSVLGADGFDSFAEMSEDRQMAIFNNITELADRAYDVLMRLDDMLSMANVKLQEASRAEDSQFSNGYAAAQAWYANMVDRMDTLARANGREGGYAVDSGLKEAFNALSCGQSGAFLDAVGAYLMTCWAYGRPTDTPLITPELLAMYASTPQKQDAWGDKQLENDDE